MRILSLLYLLVLAGCASKPMTQEEAWRYRQAGSALTNFSHQLNGMNAAPQQSTCQIRDLGGGLYNTNCVQPASSSAQSENCVIQEISPGVIKQMCF